MSNDVFDIVRSHTGFDPEKPQSFVCGVCEKKGTGAAKDLCLRGWLFMFPKDGGVEPRCPVCAIELRRKIMQEESSEELKEVLQ